MPGVLSGVSKSSASLTSEIETSSSSATLLPTTMPLTGQSSCSRVAIAADDFRSAFPGLASRSSGRNTQNYLPTAKRKQDNSTQEKKFSLSSRSPAAPSGAFTCLGSASGSNNICSAGSSGTWTPDFICLNKVQSEYTPSSSELLML